MKKMKRGLVLVLILALALTLALPAVAVGEAALTRGDAILALYTVFGEKEDFPEAGFDDVPAGSPLAEAINWAAAKGVVLGYGNGSFGAADPITREQVAAILYRYAQLLGKGFQGMWMFQLDYPDAGEIAPYADEAMHWVVMNEILTGTDEGLCPKGTVSVAEAMVILERFRAAVVVEDADLVLTSGSLTLTIPGATAELVIAEAIEDSEDGTLFTVAEKASVEAAQARGGELDGAGWLFDIRKVSGEALQEMLCYDMSGVTPFARDAEGNAYLLCTPTDVRIEREGEFTEADMEQWSLLNGWAALIPQVFVDENEGLEPFTRGNSDLEIYLNRILCGLEAGYTVSTLDFGPLEPGDVDPAPFIEKLLEGTYTYADGAEAPDGTYVVLTFPEASTRFDFFFAPEGQNLVRKVVDMDGEEYEALFEAALAGDATANAVMYDWYKAIAEAQGLSLAEDLVLTGGGLTLAIPADKAELVVAEAIEDSEDGTLFTVAEKASVEAAQALGEETDGAGWLFAVRKVSGEALQELLCYDMSGVTPFAKDAEGNVYLFCTPTDVRLVRADGYTEENTAAWAELNEWAADVPAALIDANGLEPFTRGNSDLEITLNRILCGVQTYAVSTLEFLSLEPGDVDPAPFVEKLLEGTYTYADDAEAPDGEYAVLQLPEEATRYDFFFAPEGQNLIRKVVTMEGEDYETLFRVSFADDTTATAVMSAWYDALAQAQGLK